MLDSSLRRENKNVHYDFLNILIIDRNTFFYGCFLEIHQMEIKLQKYKIPYKIL